MIFEEILKVYENCHEITLSWCQLCCVDSDRAEETTHTLETLLPDYYDHTLCSYQPLGETHFRSSLKLKLCSEEEVHKWLNDFQRSSGLTWRKSKTYPNDDGSNKYRVDLRCQHNTSSISARSTKNTCCGAIMYLILKRAIHTQQRESRSADPHMKAGYLFHVCLRNNYNHSLTSAEVLKRRDVSADTIEKLTKLFEISHSPSSALKTTKYELQVEYGDNHVHASVDRSICPDLQFCYKSVA